MMVPEEQRPVLIIIGIFNFDHGNGAGADILNQSFFDLTPIKIIRDSADDLFITPRSILE